MTSTFAPRRQLRRRALMVSIAVSTVLFTLSGCAASAGSASPGGDGAAGDVAASFAQALAEADGSAACELLAPASRSALEADSGVDCAAAIDALELPEMGALQSARAYGRSAQVRFESDVAFLTLLSDGWRVTAAGCTPRPERPYQCEVKGD